MKDPNIEIGKKKTLIKYLEERIEKCKRIAWGCSTNYECSIRHRGKAEAYTDVINYIKKL